MIDAAIRRQAPDENGGEIKGSTSFLMLVVIIINLLLILVMNSKNFSRVCNSKN
jgi:hypothetical protein